MKRLSLFTEFDKYYKGSDLQKIVSHKPLPFKYTINGTDCYFYNADLFGLFEWKIKKDGLTTNDFIDDYKKGFEAGLLHLETSERIELKDLKSKDLREGTISQLQYILFEREFKTGSKGLLDLVFNKVPLIFTEKTIYDFGYWNGIIYSIDELCENAGLRLDDLKALPPQQTEKPKSKQEQPEKLSSIITHKEAESLVSGIKTQYKNIKGKRLKLLLIALQELELLPKERIAKKFHTLCNNEFDWEIASYNAMNGYNFNSNTDTDEVEGMKQYLKTLLNTN